jgi:hypothetical protein
MSVNSLSSSTNDDDCIHLLKKNMKIPSTMKLMGNLKQNCFEIYKKNTEEILIKVRYAQNVNYEILRHSNTGIKLKHDKNYVEMTLESSYQRDLFALLFTKLNTYFL